MRNHQESGGNRYQFRLHPAPPPSPPLSSSTSSTTPPSSSASSSSSSSSSSASASPTLLGATIMTTTPQQPLQQLKPLMTKIDEVQNNSSCSSGSPTNTGSINEKSKTRAKGVVVGGTTKIKSTTTTSTITQATTKTITSNTTNAMHMQRKQFTPTSDASNSSFSSASVAGSIQDDMSDQCSLTQAGLEEYNIRASSYYDQPVLYHHQKQSSYAQSEGYHSYVSSSDSSSATPFLDRLRQESEMLSRQSLNWSHNDLSSVSCNSVAPSPTPLLLANANSLELLHSSQQPQKQRQDMLLQQKHQQQQSPSQKNLNSSESTSSTETLKWLGSMSDVSEASHATGYSAISESVSSSQLIVHSSRVLTPKRHHSESVLYLNDSNNELLPQQQHSPMKNDTKSKTSLTETQISPTLSTTHSITSNSSKIDSDRSPSLRYAANHRHSPSYPPTHASASIYSSYQSQHNSFASSRFLQKEENTDSSLAIDVSTTKPNSDDVENVDLSSSSPPPPPPYKCSSEKVSKVPPPTPAKPTPDKKSIAYDTNGLPVSPSSPNVSPGSTINANGAYRMNHRLFPVNTYAEPVHNNTSQYVLHPKPQYSAGLKKNSAKTQHQQTEGNKSLPMKSLSQSTLAMKQNKNTSNSTPSLSTPYPSWQSVAALIKDFEHTKEANQLQQQQTSPSLQHHNHHHQQQHQHQIQQQQQQQQQEQHQTQQQQPQGQPQKYTYIDPSKTHRVSNPALKAFQKNAVQSYFERQQQQQKQQQQQQQHQQQQQQHSKDQHIFQHHQQRPHSFQTANSMKDVRNSLPTTTTASTTTRSLSQLITNSPPHSERDYFNIGSKAPSPTPPPPPPRSRSLMPTVLRRSSSASDYAEFREQYIRASHEQLPIQTIRNVSSAEKLSFNDNGMPPPPPPPRGRPSLPSTTTITTTSAMRSTSSASEYAAMRDKALLQQAAALAHAQHHPQQHAPHYYSTPPHQSPPAVVEGWVPERPPKNPNLRIPSPDLPPPPASDAEQLIATCDEPLPPPPPEVYHRACVESPSAHTGSFPQLHQTSEKPPTSNRRNSFAGSATRKVLLKTSLSEHQQSPQQPPLIPKKPQNIQMAAQVSARPPTSLAQHTTKAHKVVLNGLATPANLLVAAQNRKRTHQNNNATFISVQPIMEHTATSINKCGNSNHKIINTTAAVTNTTKTSPPPPPLMPRVPVTSQAIIIPGPAMAINTKLRSNSKASYLPRQSLEKLNNLDPDHGIYKLTLNSNEDLVVSHNKSSYAIFTQAQHHHPHHNHNHHLNALQHHHHQQQQQQHNNHHNHNNHNHNNHNKHGQHNGKIPDLLLGVKLQSQPSQPQPVSPNSVNGGPALRYGSNNNLSSSSSTASSSPTASSTIYPPVYPAPPNHHRYSSPSMIVYNNNNTTTTQCYTRSQSMDINSISQSPQSKLMSQSSVDLKKPTSLETTLEEPTMISDVSQNVLSPAQSESNLSSPVQSKSPSAFKALSPNSARREFHRSVDGGNSTDARIFRAELVNATLGNTNISNHKALARKESLRENIEKITQLQSKLMSAHLSGSFDGGNMGQGLVPCTPTKMIHSPPMKSSVSLERVSPNSQAFKEGENLVVHKQHNTPPPSPKSPPAPIKGMDAITDGLKLMQRSEIVLRVNPSTHEMACQTEDLADGILTEQNAKEDSHTNRTSLQPRQRLAIEVDCDNKTQELASLLPTEDKLLTILSPQTPKSPSDYVSNLYNPDVPLRPSKRDVGTSTLMSINQANCDGRVEDETEIELEFKEIEITLTNGLKVSENGDDDDDDENDQVKKKVEELIKQIKRKVIVLNKEQSCIDEETSLNDELGNNLSNKLAQKVRPLEATKFRTYIDDVGHITSLLLSLAERLARTENAINNIENDAEKKTLEKKRDRLYEQLDEAKRLKKDIERRGDIMTNMLQYNLGPSDNADFDYFINMKAKLITDARDIAEKIKCSEEHLNALNETLIQSDC